MLLGLDARPGHETKGIGELHLTVGWAREAFGTITSAGDPRVVQLAVKFVF